MDKKYKLYRDGAFFDLRRDPVRGTEAGAAFLPRYDRATMHSDRAFRDLIHSGFIAG
jgi:hypothetical protein